MIVLYCSSQNDEVAISIMVIRSVEIVISLILLIFGVVAVLSGVSSVTSNKSCFDYVFD